MVGEFLVVAFGGQKASLAVNDDLGNSAVVETDDRKTGCLGFGKNHA